MKIWFFVNQMHRRSDPEINNVNSQFKNVSGQVRIQKVFQRGYFNFLTFFKCSFFGSINLKQILIEKQNDSSCIGGSGGMLSRKFF